MTPLPLSKTLDPADYAHLAPELAFVDAVGVTGQHMHRRWEYAVALHAMARWGVVRSLYDIGGAGSPFATIARTALPALTTLRMVDPAGDPTDPVAYPYPLAAFVRSAPAPADAVTCLSVVEHIADLETFLYHLAAIVRPGGLLILTMDYSQQCGPDRAHFFWMRERLFCPKTYKSLTRQLATLALTPVGEVDLTDHHPQVYDYTFASLVLEKQKEP